MDVKKIVNIFCAIAGICIIIFGAMTRSGAIDGVDPVRGMVPVVLGIIIVAWAVISMYMSSRR